MYIFIDIGGTNTRIGVSSDLTSLNDHLIFETPENYPEGIDILNKKISEIKNGEKIDGIVIGLPGPLNSAKTCLESSPHLGGWVGAEITNDLGNTFSCGAYLENDAALVGLGEAVYGAGRGKDIVVYITVSTGVGGVRIVGGRIDENKHGFEIGHQHIKDGITLEDLVSGESIEKKYNTAPRQITDERVWQEYADDLALGVSNTVLFWSPDIIVIGGSMSRSVLFDRLNIEVAKDTRILKNLPAIVPSELDSIGGLYGGLAYMQNIIKKQ